MSASRAPTSAPAWRCSSPRCAPTAPRRSATSSRSTAATSASTSACATSARGSSGSRSSRSRPSAATPASAGEADDPPDPPGNPGHPARRDARAAPARALALVEAFERFGYGEVRDADDRVRGGARARRSERGAPVAYRFFDESGELLAMRSDMTIPIARLVANRYAAAEPPFRLCYLGPRLPGGPPAARPDARVHPGRGRAGRRSGARRAPPRWSRCSPRRSTPPA